MAKMTSLTGRSLEIERDMIEVSTSMPRPDPKWSYTDHAGHPHAFDEEPGRYPTLVRRESEPYWCTECQDEHTTEWLECPLCGEKVTPGTYIDPSPQFIPGLTSYRIDGREVPPEEGKALLDELQAEHESRLQEQQALQAGEAERAMLAEGLSAEQVERVMNRMAHGHPHVPGTNPSA